MPTSIFLDFEVGQTLTSPSIASPTISNPTFTGQELEADGTSGAPSKSYTSEPTLGFWRSSAGQVSLQGSFASSSNVTAASGAFFLLGNRGIIGGPSVGNITFANAANTIGSQLKVDALPTVTAGGGTSPSVTAGSTPFAGSVNVGSGAPGATITVTWGGTAFPSAPFVVCMNLTTGLAVKAAATTTTLVITPATGNFGASDVISWLAVSSK